MRTLSMHRVLCRGVQYWSAERLPGCCHPRPLNFLDGFHRRIVEVDAGEARSYAGNYSGPQLALAKGRRSGKAANAPLRRTRFKGRAPNSAAMGRAVDIEHQASLWPHRPGTRSRRPGSNGSRRCARHPTSAPHGSKESQLKPSQHAQPGRTQIGNMAVCRIAGASRERVDAGYRCSVGEQLLLP